MPSQIHPDEIAIVVLCLQHYREHKRAMRATPPTGMPLRFHAATGELPSPEAVVESLLADPVRSALRGKVREIGQALMTRGGLSLMHAMADEVEKSDIPSAGATLDKWWNGISNGKQIWAS